MATTLLMPKATAVWLVDNTALSFEQIAAFCGLHPLEVQGVADGDVAGGIMGVNPIQNGQLTREEIEKAEADPAYRLKVSDPKVRVDRRQAQGSALHPDLAPQRAPERHPLAAAQPSRTQGRPDHASGRHHQVDHRFGAREHPLELGQYPADGSGDAGSLQPDRSRPRSEARRQGHRLAGRGRSGHHADDVPRKRWPPPAAAPAPTSSSPRTTRAVRSTRRTSTPTPCLPS